ncbi:lipocalin family protein [Thiocapsa marina]|uniref:Outer membrane lipoprotein Blc n=1 Tax=Thiocapsa marina 5811 TaxID=768671 RepID=F9UIB3_9GAMM|nr:Lipocalin family protein [Thiocapsa marina 5811]
MKRLSALLLITLMLAFASGCTEEGGAPMDTVKQVDLERFMGKWYVIANIPTFVEKGAYNAVESYALNPDGTIATTFIFNKDGFDGPLKTHNPKGFVRDTTTNALWWMQFIWPFKADFRIVWLEPDYSITVIGRAKRDYVWIMAREPEIPQAKYDEIVAFIGGLGYDTSKIEKVPQRSAG